MRCINSKLSSSIKLILLACLCTGLPLLAAKAPVIHPNSLPMDQAFLDAGDYYLVRGERIYLRRDAQRVVVKFKEQSSLNQAVMAASMPSSNKSQGLLLDASTRTSLHTAMGISEAQASLSVEKRIQGNGLSIVRVTPVPGSAVGASSMIQQASVSSDVAFTVPLYISKAGIGEVIVTDEINIRFRPDISLQAAIDFCAAENLEIVRSPVGSLNVYLVRLLNLNGPSCLDKANTLNDHPEVVWAEPNVVSELRTQSLGPSYNEQWHLNNTGQQGSLVDTDVDAPEAWAEQEGSPNVVIAIIDSGVDLSHEDLAIWNNPGESGQGRESNGIDDDGNGYVDDYQGWDFFDSDNDPGPGGFHGTACAGVAAARGDNNVGGVGVAYGCKVLAVKITQADTNFVSSAVQAAAIQYAADHADILSCSWSVSISSYVMDAIDYAVSQGRGGRGCPVLVATGNGAARGWTQAQITGFPAGYQGHAWVYFNPDNAEPTPALNAAWLDDVRLQNGTVETFNQLTGSVFPPDWLSFNGQPANWSVVSDSGHVVGEVGKSLRSGALTGLSNSGVFVYKYYPSSGYYNYRVWVDAGEGRGLYARYWTGSQWLSYRYFMGAGISFPASYSNAIAVGACNNLGKQSPYSQYGNGIDFVAPSNGGSLGITTTDVAAPSGYNPAGNYNDNFGGTSSATPLAAGIAALMLSANGNLTAEDVRTMMRDSADDMETPGFDIYTGYGRVNAYAAVSAALASVGSSGLSIDTFSPATNLVFLTEGQLGVFSASATSTESGLISCQWYFDDTMMSGETQEVFQITSGAGMVGPHLLMVSLSDEGGNSADVEWQVLVGEGDPELLGYWSFNDGSGLDRSGWGNSLSITGRVSVTWDGVSANGLRFLPNE